MEQDWDKYFWEVQERYFRVLENALKSRLEVAGDAEYAKKMFLFASGLNQFLHQSDDFTQKLLASFDHFVKLDRAKPISLVLTSYQDFRKLQLETKRQKDISERREVKIEYEYKTWLDRLLSRPSGGKIPINSPLTFSNDLINQEGERPVVKYLIKYYTYQRLERHLSEKEKPKSEIVENEAPEDDLKFLKIKKPKVGKRKANEKITALNEEQTVLLIHYLGQTDTIFNGETSAQTKGEIAKAFEILTGYKQEALRQKLSNPEKSKSNLREVKKILEKTISLIIKDLEPK